MQGGYIERLMHSVAGLRMRKIKREQRRRRQAAARPAQRNARICKTAQLVPRIAADGRRGIVEISHQAPIHSSNGCVADGFNNMPRGSAIRIDSSHTSNSGARRKPSTLRTYSASWNDVL